MCRFLAYKGHPVIMDELLYQPKNSLIKQSVAAHESEEPLNGDGFGVGWYSRELDQEPGLFVSVRPAWNDRNLKYLAKKIKSSCIFAHVRAASTGEVSEANCHPFHFKNFMFMHNGGIEGFQHIKRFIRRKLSDEIYDWIRGQTDSEHLFALFLENLKSRGPKPSVTEMADTIEETVNEIQEIKNQHGIKEASYINLCISEGKHLIAMKYVSDPKEKASTLYYTAGARYECHNGICQMVKGKPQEHAVLIVSEKLTNSKTEWKEIPTNSILVVNDELQVALRPMKVVAPKGSKKSA